MRSKGYRSNTRSKFRKAFKDSTTVKTSTLLHQYKRGDYVSIKVDPSIHKGMPHSYYHGRTGRVYAVFDRALGVAVTKRVGNRVVVKQVIARIEHVKPSNCQKDKLERDAFRAKYNMEPPRNVPKGPRQAFTLSLDMNTPVEVRPVMQSVGY